VQIMTGYHCSPDSANLSAPQCVSVCVSGCVYAANENTAGMYGSCGTVSSTLVLPGKPST